jgi:hypothetical protein
MRRAKRLWRISERISFKAGEPAEERDKMAMATRQPVQTRQGVKRAVIAAVLACGASGCVPHKISGTEIDDTPATRALLAVVDNYRRAVERRDAAGVYALADESFRDDGGSAMPDDDLDYQQLKTTLPGRLEKLQDVRLDVTVKSIEFDEDLHLARVTYTYQVTWRMQDYTHRAQSETDIKQMILKQVGKEWKITSGI